MKRFILVLVIGLSVSSCTYDDVYNYLSGKQNNLTVDQKKEADIKYKSATPEQLQKIDRGDTRP